MNQTTQRKKKRIYRAWALKGLKGLECFPADMPRIYLNYKTALATKNRLNDCFLPCTVIAVEIQEVKP
jgi:hypothetical protein